MNILEIKKMSIIERLQAMEALWDSLLNDGTEIESPKWHHDILEERIKNIENGNVKFISIEDLNLYRKA